MDGVDLPTAQRISGHKTLAMVLRYTHVHGSHIDAAVEHLEHMSTSHASPKRHQTGEEKSATAAGRSLKVVK